MGKKCVVPSCTTGYDSNKEKISVFSFPKDKINEWKKAIGRNDREFSSRHVVCAKHFREEDIIRVVTTGCYSYDLKTPKLAKGAVPCIFSNKFKKERGSEELPVYKETQSNDDLNFDASNSAETSSTDDLLPETKKVKLELATSLDNEDINCESPVIDSGHASSESPDIENYVGEIAMPSFDYAETPTSGNFPLAPNNQVKLELVVIPISDNNFRDSSSRSCASTEFSAATLFDNLCKGLSVKLPSNTWAVHYIPDLYNNSGIFCMAKMVIHGKDVITEKKILVKKENIQCYIFNNPIELENLSEVKSVEKLQNLIEDFDKMKVCYGALEISKCPNNFNNSNYKIDCNNVWRHIKCSYTTINIRRKCTFCKKMTTAINLFRKSNTEMKKTRKMLLLKKKLRGSRRQSKRLSLRINKITEELKTKQNNETNEEFLFKTVDELEHISSTQKILIKECINSAKCRKKNSRRYTSEWLLTCLLLHTRSPAVYQFLKNNEIMPLPTYSTIRRCLARDKIHCGLDETFSKAIQKEIYSDCPDREENTFEQDLNL